MNTTLSLFWGNKLSNLRKFGEQIAEVLGKPPVPLKNRRLKLETYRNKIETTYTSTIQSGGSSDGGRPSSERSPSLVVGVSIGIGREAWRASCRQVWNEALFSWRDSTKPRKLRIESWPVRLRVRDITFFLRECCRSSHRAIPSLLRLRILVRSWKVEQERRTSSKGASYKIFTSWWRRWWQRR